MSNDPGGRASLGVTVNPRVRRSAIGGAHCGSSAQTISSSEGSSAHACAALSSKGKQQNNSLKNFMATLARGDPPDAAICTDGRAVWATGADSVPFRTRLDTIPNPRRNVLRLLVARMAIEVQFGAEGLMNPAGEVQPFRRPGHGTDGARPKVMHGERERAAAVPLMRAVFVTVGANQAQGGHSIYPLNEIFG